MHQARERLIKDATVRCLSSLDCALLIAVFMVRRDSLVVPRILQMRVFDAFPILMEGFDERRLHQRRSHMCLLSQIAAHTDQNSTRMRSCRGTQL